jgi:SAM-dependent methyltransferase
MGDAGTIDGLSSSEMKIVVPLNLPLSLYFAHVIPTHAAIAEIAACGPILEVGAGSGYWARLTRQAGAEVVAVDLIDYTKTQFEDMLREARLEVVKRAAEPARCGASPTDTWRRGRGPQENSRDR